MKPNTKTAAGIARCCLLLLCLSGWYGCSPSLYIPNMVDTPLLSKQGNLKINAAVSLAIVWCSTTLKHSYFFTLKS